MRLIDADKVYEERFTRRKIEEGVVVHVNIIEASKVKNAPTINAIPIEWLKMWFIKNGYLSGIALVDKIESDWKKENGVEESTRNI